MSSTIDSRVVEMRFDNKQFESGAKQSISTLDRLKEALSSSTSTRSFDLLQRVANGVNLNGLSSAVDGVKLKFSALEVAAITALQNVVNKAVDAGERLVKSLSIDQVMAGFEEYGLKMNSIQTIMASTGESLQTVNGYLNELNTYSDRTIYSFSDMTQNIGKFTNAGVKLPEAVKAIQGISNAAAVAGANSNEASRAMYNFAQALSAGSVKLIDWKSIENANMATVDFKQQLIDTAVAMGTLVKVGDEYKSTTTDMNGKVSQAFTSTSKFNESLSAQWMTSDVLVQTLSNYSNDIRDMSKEERAAYEEKLKSIGYTDEQIKGIEKLGQKAFDSAQDVKTFSQLMDTLKESVGSGWAQTFELLIGDFEEAKKLWTDVNNVIGNILSEQAKSRNELLQGWKDAGGRDALLEGLANSWKAIVAIIKPVKEAFRDIFPKTTSQQLVDLTTRFKDFTSNLIISGDTSDKLKRTFSGLFSVLNILKQIFQAFVTLLSPGVSLIKTLAGGVLDVTAAVGDWATGINNATSKHQFFLTQAETLLSYLDGLKEKFKALSGSGIDKLGSLLSSIGEGIKNIIESFTFSGSSFESVVSTIKEVLVSFGKAVTSVFTGGGLDRVMNLLGSGIMAQIGLDISDFVKGLTSVTGSANGFISGLSSIKDSVVDTFSAIQSQLKAGALLKIAGAIGILAAALVVISSIESDKLDKSLGAITILFGDLFGMMAAFEKIMNGSGMKAVSKISKSVIALSTSVLILASAMQKIASIPSEKLTSTLTVVSALLAEMTGVAITLSKYGKKIDTGAAAMVAFAGSIAILSYAVQQLGGMDTNQMIQGLSGVAILMEEMTLFTLLLGEADHVKSSAAAMLIMAASLNLLAIPLQIFGNMSWEQLGKGLTTMGIAMAELVAAMNLMPKNLPSLGVGMAAVASSLLLIGAAIKQIGSLSWEQIGKGLTAIGIALAELAVGLNLMKGTLSGSAALLVASVSILALTPALKALGSMSLESIIKSLIALGGAFAVIGAAGVLLGPLAPTIMALSAAVALLGVGVLAAGAGILAFSAALSSLAGSGAIAVVAFVSTLRVLFVGIFNAVRDSAKSFGEAVKAVVLEACDVLVTCVPTIVESVLKIVKEVLNALAKNAPEIVDSLMKFIIGVIDKLRENLPTLVKSVVDLFVTFFSSIIEALKSTDVNVLQEALEGVGVIALIMTALAALSTLAPGAMTGVLAMGGVIAELAVLLAAIGALSEIPGLQWLIGKGGDLLQGIGTAIGKFIGGIVGGFMSGVSAQFPKIAMDLSMFMVNLQPFLVGAKNIDANLLTGVQALAKTILVLTATSILEGLANWLTGGNSLVKFGQELAMFAPLFNAYYIQVKNIDGKVVKASANAAGALAEMSKNLPNQGGLVSWFTGDNRLSVFGRELNEFGPMMAKYADQVKDLKPKVVTASANAAKALSELANNLPNQGGLVSWFTGDNDLGTFGKSLTTFGKSMNEYYKSVSGIDTSLLSTVIKEVKKLVDIAKSVEGIDTSGMSKFGKDLKNMGDRGINEFIKAFKNSVPKVKSTGKTLCDTLVKQMNITLSAAQMKKIGKNAGTNLSSGLKSSTSTVQSAGKSLGNAAKKGVTSVITQRAFKGIGQDAGTGLANGIRSKINSIANAAIQAAQTAVNSARRQLQVASPSKVFMEMGEFVSLGLAKGITDKLSAIAQAGASMADGAIDPVQMALDRINNAMEDEIDLNPSIVPTIDLSQVMDGANRISSMFGGFNLAPSTALAQGAYASFGRAASSADLAGENNKKLLDKMDELIDTTKESDNGDTINNIYINSTDPREAAEEVGYVLQRQYERGKAAWAR